MEIITRLDEYSDVHADLSGVTVLNKNAQKNDPSLIPLTKAVETVARHQGAGYSPSTNIIVTSENSLSRNENEKNSFP